MGIFNFLKKKQVDDPSKFKDTVIDEIDKLNAEFSKEKSTFEPDMPPKPIKLKSITKPETVEEPKDIEEDIKQKNRNQKIISMKKWI